ncbi:hypothetical protein B9Z55_007975 [Caenorhabditis nigoni]|uniref:Uncharacterized protein n=1 Tax=Caenorhabditis nigoni TaxID=1611254 RepID=A0A2G5VCP8_9PELO|nr:hypothetical protein B9Z55_007975 [Caenorhabditis nigoni]
MAEQGEAHLGEEQNQNLAQRMIALPRLEERYIVPPEIPNVRDQGLLGDILQEDEEEEEDEEDEEMDEQDDEMDEQDDQMREEIWRQARQQVGQVVQNGVLQRPDAPNRRPPIDPYSHIFEKARGIFRAREYTERCEICNQDIVRTEFLDHLKPCAQQNGKDVKETHIPEYRFLSTNYMLDQKMFEIRDKLEIKFLEVLWNKENVDTMNCILCRTFEEHMNGDCMPDYQKQAFFHYMDGMLNMHMFYYEHLMELKKERGEEEIRQAHENGFERMKAEVDQRFPGDNVIAEDNRQREYREFQERVAEANQKEIREYWVRKNEQSRSQWEFKKRQVEAIARREAELIHEYLKSNNRRKDLDKVIEYRKILRDQGWEAAEEFDRATFPTPQNVPDARNEETRIWLREIVRRQREGLI